MGRGTVLRHAHRADHILFGTLAHQSHAHAALPSAVMPQLRERAGDQRGGRCRGFHRHQLPRPPRQRLDAERTRPRKQVEHTRVLQHGPGFQA